MPSLSRSESRSTDGWAAKRYALGRTLGPLLRRRPVQFLLDGFCGSFAVMIAYLLRFDMRVPDWAAAQLEIWAVVLFFAAPAFLALAHGYRSTWRHFNERDFGALAFKLLSLSGLVLLLDLLLSGRRVMPFGVVVINFMFTLAFTAGVRMLRRIDQEILYRLAVTDRILVLGTEETVGTALRQLRSVYGSRIIGIVTADDSLHSLRVAGVPVLGNASQLTTILHTHAITLLFLCSADVTKMSNVLEIASDMDVAVKFLPSVQDLMSNRVRTIKNVTVDALREDELGVAEELPAAVLDCLRDRTVLVTGAAGSIGSELVRQISRTPYRRLLVLDQDENGVFELLGEIGQKEGLTPIIADIRDASAIRNVFERDRPDVVFHAAAYKHVPLMEQNPCEAVLNNVIGTRILAEAAMEFHAARFVMISSDKAVHPSSVMGATKRLSELVIQDFASRLECPVEFACVRFGNVLGSRGSVLPIFLRQIEAGGPITVTHAEMTRYFMTIPQAVNLVLCAATLASCGHIYMLDMGDPVRIVSFARKVIQLSGLTPDKDIEIKIVGARAGEKLHEQLWSADAKVTPTAFGQVFQVEAEKAGNNFDMLLTRLEYAAHDHNSEQVRKLLRELPIDYVAESAALQSAAATPSDALLNA